MGNFIGAVIFLLFLGYALDRREDVGLFGNPNLKQDKENAERLRRQDD